MREFLEVFIPLFVTIDAFGMVPIFLAMTQAMPTERRRTVTFEAVSVALIVAVGFMVLGEAIFLFLGISESDFRIAGGILLLVLAVYDLLIRGKPGVEESDEVGVFPLALPLIAGPATLTTTLVLVRQAGYVMTTLSLIINFAILLLALLTAGRIARVLGETTLRAFSKLVMILLAAIAVNFIRGGIMDAIAEAARVPK